jgi:hypothetical protein
MTTLTREEENAPSEASTTEAKETGTTPSTRAAANDGGGNWWPLIGFGVAMVLGLLLSVVCALACVFGVKKDKPKKNKVANIPMDS